MHIIPISAFSDNYIWLIKPENSQKCAVVDPGDATPVLETLNREGLTLTDILITHHHADHIGGLAELVATTHATVYGPKHERIPHCTHPLEEGDEIILKSLNLTFAVLDIPGHTAGHIAYVGHDCLFCGDTLFAAGCGRLFEGTAAQMHHSLSKLKTLPGHTRVYCAHEYTAANCRFACTVAPQNPDIAARAQQVNEQRQRDECTLPSTIALERATNPFLRWEDPEIIASASQYVDHTLGEDVEVFAAIRAWKDNF